MAQTPDSRPGVTPDYDPREIELRWQAAWEAQEAFLTPLADADGGSDRYARWIYIKASAPFTSGNIHMGHVRSYAIGDAYARYCRSRGDAVLFSFGWDAFGLPAELAARQRDLTPTEWVRQCAEVMTGQLARLGLSFGWERTFNSSEPTMYRWSQWLFLRLLEAGLIYRGTGTVDWCPTCHTTLATIQVENGTCWRCHGPVELVERPEWILRVSAYVEENDRGAAGLKHWDDVALGSQREVLGRVDGVEVDLVAGDDNDRAITVFTPHSEGLAEARFVLLSPRHEQLSAWTARDGLTAELEEMRQGGWDRAAREADAVPVLDTGIAVGHPSGGRPLPVLISPLVDSRYGPTAVLGIPGRDRTDAVIARRMGLTGGDPQGDDGDETGAAEHSTAAASGAAATQVRAAVRYRARDFSVSRQRHWGTPIPIVYCERCGTVPVPVEQLPVILPVDLKPTGPENPLAEDPAFYETTCPRCDAPARRETDTLDCHFDALWLWIPACVPASERERPLEEILALADLRTWLPSERLVAGSDSGNFMFDQRIITKALRDIGPLAFLADGEPFAGALMHEMVIRDGRKMSKHLGNVVEPDALVEEVGADTVRLAVLYAARPQRSLNWSESAVAHCHRFLNAVWTFAQRALITDPAQLPSSVGEEPRLMTDHLRRKLAGHCDVGATRIEASLAELEMHSAVRDVMRLFERIGDFEKAAVAKRGHLSREDHDSIVEALSVLVRWLDPFAPHMAAELAAAGLDRTPHRHHDLQTA